MVAEGRLGSTGGHQELCGRAGRAAARRWRSLCEAVGHRSRGPLGGVSREHRKRCLQGERGREAEETPGGRGRTLPLGAA